MAHQFMPQQASFHVPETYHAVGVSGGEQRVVGTEGETTGMATGRKLAHGFPFANIKNYDRSGLPAEG